ncbi:MAG TPA: GYD domain-containing protein, partial [Candidatus Binatia bacterium]|nr:GYD domain-containing protein [Candidatus Binatia bacterium]
QKGGFTMARAVVLLKLTREGAMSIEQARAIYEETKIFFGQTGYKVVDLYATLGEYDFVSIIEVPDQNAIKHLFRRGVLAADHGAFEVCTLPALPFEEFLTVVDDLRPAEGSA